MASATKRADDIAENRKEDEGVDGFFGWFIIEKNDVENMGRVLQRAELPSNKFHANIVIPEVEDYKSEWEDHALDLLYASEWVSRVDL